MPTCQALNQLRELAVARRRSSANALDEDLPSRIVPAINPSPHRFAAVKEGATKNIGHVGKWTRRNRCMMKQSTLKWIIVFTGFALLRGSAGAQDAFMGEYEGAYQADRSQTTKATAKVIAEGPGYYRVVVQAQPLASGDSVAQFEIYGVQQGTKVSLFGRANANQWHGVIMSADKLVADPGYYGVGLELKKTTRTSPAEGAPPPTDAVVLLPFAPGKPPETAAWEGGPRKPQADGSLQCDPGKGGHRSGPGNISET